MRLKESIMGKYCYVYMRNRLFYSDDKGTWHDTETRKLTSSIAVNRDLGYYQPQALAFLNIKKEVRTVRDGRRQRSYMESIPVFMICEEKENCFEDVITGIKYGKVINKRGNIRLNFKH